MNRHTDDSTPSTQYPEQAMTTHTSSKPLTDKAWMDEMIIELRLRQVSGRAIGDAAAAVESHCAESGEPAAQAFGDPRSYARSLAFAPDQFVTSSRAEWGRLLAPIGAGLVAMNLAGPLVRAVVEHHAVQLHWGELASALMLVVFVWLTMKILGAVLQSMLIGALFFGGAIASMAAVTILWRTPVFTLPAAIVGLLIAACLAYSVLGQRRNRSLQHDPLVDPRHPEQQTTPLAIATEWLFVLLTLAMGLLAWIPLALR